MSLEDDLRVTLRDHADESAPRHDLWLSVEAGVRRDRRRRTVVASAAAAVALVVVASVPVILSRRDAAPVPVAPVPVPSVDVSWVPRAFPMKPSWMPAGAGERRVLVLGANTHVSYERDTTVLSAEIGPIQPDWEVEGVEDHRATVNGVSAQVRTGTYDGGTARDRYVGVRWRLDDGQWAQVLSFGPWTEAQVLRFASGLGEGSVPVDPAPFTFATVPPGLTLQHQSEDMMCLASPQTLERERHGTGLCVTRTEEADLESDTSETLRVGGRPAEYDPESRSLTVDLDGSQWLDVSWSEDSMPFSREDLVRFAEGITIER